MESGIQWAHQSLAGWSNHQQASCQPILTKMARWIWSGVKEFPGASLLMASRKYVAIEPPFFFFFSRNRQLKLNRAFSPLCFSLYTSGPNLPIRHWNLYWNSKRRRPHCLGQRHWLEQEHFHAWAPHSFQPDRPRGIGTSSSGMVRNSAFLCVEQAGEKAPPYPSAFVSSL